MDPDIVGALKCLSDATRLRVLGRLAAGAAPLDELARDLGLPLNVLVRQVGLLRRFDLVGPPGRSTADAYHLRIDTLQRIGAALDERERATLDPSLPAADARIVRGYLEDGRLATIPAHTGKRLVVLRWLLDEVFTEDREYPEKEVNQRLALYHPDVASLRRYMVDAGLLARERGVYRRAADSDPRRGGLAG